MSSPSTAIAEIKNYVDRIFYNAELIKELNQDNLSQSRKLEIENHPILFSDHNSLQIIRYLINKNLIERKRYEVPKTSPSYLLGRIDETDLVPVMTELYSNIIQENERNLTDQKGLGILFKAVKEEFESVKQEHHFSDQLKSHLVDLAPVLTNLCSNVQQEDQKEVKNLFAILEEEFVNDKKKSDFYDRLKVYVDCIVGLDYVFPQPYFIVQSAELNKIENLIIELFDNRDIAEAFDHLDKQGYTDVAIEEYKRDFILGISEKNLSWYQEFKTYLLQKFRYQQVLKQKNKLFSQLSDYLQNVNIHEYFSRLVHLGLKDTKFDLLKHDFVRGNISYGVYQELQNYAVEAVDWLFERAVKENRMAESIFLKSFSNYSAGSWDMFGDFTCHFQPQINLLLGRNGYGKTHFLRRLISILQDTQEIKKIYPSPYRLSVEWGKERFEITPRQFWIFGKIPVLGITDSRFMDKSADWLRPQEMEMDLDLETDGAYFFLHQKSMQNLVSNLFSSFANQNDTNLPIFDLMSKVILDLTGTERFEFVDIVAGGDTYTGAKYQIMVKTEASNIPLHLQKVSQGTMSVLVIVGMIYDFLKKLYPNSKNFTQESGIVFIDEIDAHLHPSWQRKIIPLLRKTFPHVQFFLSAHSPLLVAGCLYGEVSVMRKDDIKGNFYVQNLEKHFLGADVEDLYMEVFGLEEDLEKFGLEDLKDEKFLEILKELENREEIEKLRKSIEEMNQKDELSEEEKIDFNKKVANLYYYSEVMKNRNQKRQELNQAIELGTLRAKLYDLERENEELKTKLEQNSHE